MAKRILLIAVLAAALAACGQPIIPAATTEPKHTEPPRPTVPPEPTPVPATATPMPAPTDTPPPTPVPIPVWQSETVDSAGTGDFSLALDSAGRPHISYRGAYNNNLRYAFYDGTGWQIETVDNSVGLDDSLTLDAAGRPHIGYSVDTELRYAHRDGGTWTIERVDDGVAPSLALDGAGLPRISYWFDGLRYAYYDGARWITTTVQAGIGLLGGPTSLALDAAGRPHISFYEHTSEELRYAHLDGGAWTVETVADVGFIGTGSSLVLDAAGRPRISYSREITAEESELMYAHYDGSGLGQAHGWQIETVDSGGQFGMNTSLALDAAGRPHITYYKQSASGDGELRYAYRDGLGLEQAQGWRIETLDSGGDVHGRSSLALDAQDLLHVVYYDPSTGGLKYGRYH